MKNPFTLVFLFLVWRCSFVHVPFQVFNLDADLLNAEIETLERIPRIADQSVDLISEKRKRLVDQVCCQACSNCFTAVSGKQNSILSHNITKFLCTFRFMSLD